MNPRLATKAALCREVALPALVLVCLAVAGSAEIRHSDAVPIVSRLAPSLAAEVKFADKPPPVAVGNTDVAMPAVQSMEIAADTTPPIAVEKPDIVAAGAPVLAALAEPAPGADQPSRSRNHSSWPP